MAKVLVEMEDGELARKWASNAGFYFIEFALIDELLKNPEFQKIAVFSPRMLSYTKKRLTTFEIVEADRPD